MRNWPLLLPLLSPLVALATNRPPYPKNGMPFHSSSTACQ